MASFPSIVSYDTNLFNKDGSKKLTIKRTFIPKREGVERKELLAEAQAAATTVKTDYEAANSERLKRWGETVKVEAVKEVV